MKAWLVIAFRRGVPWSDPLVTTSEDKAEARHLQLCEELGLEPEDPHDGESDVWTWRVEIEWQ